MQTKPNIVSLRRIRNDLLELQKEPSVGIGIVQLGNNFYEYLVNIKILTGIYTGLILQLKLEIPNNFPIEPPTLKIFPNQKFDGSYHHHVFLDNNGTGFYVFCNDLTKNQFMSTHTEGTGWTPAYTIKCVLIQFQNFLANHDFSRAPDAQMVENLIKFNKSYTKEFKNDNGDIFVHSYEKPYPEIYCDGINQDFGEIINLNSKFNNNNDIIDKSVSINNDEINLNNNEALIKNHQYQNEKYTENLNNSSNNVEKVEILNEIIQEKAQSELKVGILEDQSNSKDFNLSTIDISNLSINTELKQNININFQKELDEIKNNLTCYTLNQIILKINLLH